MLNPHTQNMRRSRPLTVIVHLATRVHCAGLCCVSAEPAGANQKAGAPNPTTDQNQISQNGMPATHPTLEVHDTHSQQTGKRTTVATGGGRLTRLNIPGVL